MWTIFLALAAGVAVGAFNLLPAGAYKLIDRLMGVILFFLIFMLAVGVGSDAMIFASSRTIGLKALVLSAGAIVGSIGLLYLVQQKWFREER